MTAWEMRIGRYYLGPVHHMALSYMRLANVPHGGLTVVLLKS